MVWTHPVLDWSTHRPNLGRSLNLRCIGPGSYVCVGQSLLLIEIWVGTGILCFTLVRSRCGPKVVVIKGIIRADSIRVDWRVGIIPFRLKLSIRPKFGRSFNLRCIAPGSYVCVGQSLLSIEIWGGTGILCFTLVRSRCGPKVVVIKGIIRLDSIRVDVVPNVIIRNSIIYNFVWVKDFSNL